MLIKGVIFFAGCFLVGILARSPMWGFILGAIWGVCFTFVEDWLDHNA